MSRFEQLRERHKKELAGIEKKLKNCRKPTVLRDIILDCAALFVNLKCDWCHDDRMELLVEIKRKATDNGRG